MHRICHQTRDAVKALALFLLLICAAAQAATNGITTILAAGEWSEPVKDKDHYGLRGRLLLCETPQHRGMEGYDTAVYLELQEWSPFAGSPLLVYCNMNPTMAMAPDFKTVVPAGLLWELRNAQDKPVPESGFAFSGGGPQTQWMVVACDGSVRPRASLFGGGRLEDGGLGLALPAHYWVVPKASTNEFFLSATFTSNPPTNNFSPLEYHVWQGTITLPKMKIPVLKP